MNGITLKTCSNKKILSIPFLVFSTLLLSENVLSRQHWNRNFFDVWKVKNTLDIKIQVFYFDFVLPGVHAFLYEFDCEYSFDDRNYKHLMSVSTRYQLRMCKQRWVDVKRKLPGAKIYFCYCYNPPGRVLWGEDQNCRVEICNWSGGNTFWLCLKWDLEQDFKNVKSLRISGTWWVMGQERNDMINKEVYVIDKIYPRSKIPVSIDSLHNQVKRPFADLPDNNETRVCGVADAIVVQGAERGQNIKVYTTSGALIKSIIANNDVEQIKLSSNQIYIVNIAQNRHRVAL